MTPPAARADGGPDNLLTPVGGPETTPRGPDAPDGTPANHARPASSDHSPAAWDAPPDPSNDGAPNQDDLHVGSVGPGDDADAAIALDTAARGFLVSRWIGALLMVYSFTHLYAFGLRPGASLRATFAIAGLSMGLGTLVWWRSRVYAARLDVPWGRRGQAAADLFAYTAMVFWLLLLVALWLLSQGVALF